MVTCEGSGEEEGRERERWRIEEERRVVEGARETEGQIGTSGRRKGKRAVRGTKSKETWWRVVEGGKRRKRRVRERKSEREERRERDKDGTSGRERMKRQKEGGGGARANACRARKERSERGKSRSPPLVRRSGGRTTRESVVGRKTERLYRRPGRKRDGGGGETLLTPPSIQDGVGSGSPRH